MKSYLKFLSRNALYTAVEAAGLVVSMAFVIITGCYIAQQYAVKNENPDRKNIYTFGSTDYIGETFAFNDEIRSRLPEIEVAARYSTGISGIAIVRGENIHVAISTADKNFFEIFPYYKFLTGGPECLDSRSAVVISESFAKAHGLENGGSLTLDGNELVIGAVIEDFKRTLFKYTDLIVSPLNSINQFSWSAPYDHWGSVVPFVRVRKGTDRQEFARKVDDICKEIYKDVYGSGLYEKTREYRLDELFFSENNHSNFNAGDKSSLQLLLLVGLLVLISAVFNYVNLNFALTGRRAKEMAVRRLNGASSSGVFMRYIAESVIFACVCMVLSVLVAVWFTPTMNSLINDPDIPASLDFSPVYVLSFILFAVVVGVISGLSPAMLACGYKPIDIVSGHFRRRGKMVFSKVFIVLQNALAMFLIGLAGVMEVQYAKSLQLPMNADIEGKYIVMVMIPGYSQFQLRDKLETLPCVRNIGRVQGAPGISPGGQYSTRRDGGEIMYRTCRMDSTAFAMLKPEIVKNLYAPLYNSVWFSERAWTETGFDDDYYDITVLSQRADGCGQVAGIVKDFPVATNNMDADYPVIIPVMRTEDMYYGGWLMDITGDYAQAREQIRKAYAEWSEDAFGSYIAPRYDNYLRDNFLEGLRPVRNNMRLIELLMALAVLISMLGLFAMSVYYAGENAKTTAIRKVFGGTIESETRRNVREYMILAIIACLIGLPLAFRAASKYLQAFVYRLESWWWIILLAACFTMLISFLAVLWQTLACARTNPIDVLKKE